MSFLSVWYEHRPGNLKLINPVSSSETGLFKETSLVQFIHLQTGHN